jgi:ribosome-associated translation inhibitor RaiA
MCARNHQGETILPKTSPINTFYGNPKVTIKSKVYYIKFKTKVKPTNEKKSYEEDSISFKNELSQKLNKILSTNKHISKDFLFTIDLSDKNLKYNKFSNLKVCIYIKPNIIKSHEHHQPLFEKIAANVEKIMKKELEKIDFELG